MNSKRWIALVVAIALFLLSLGIGMSEIDDSDSLATDFPVLFQDTDFKEKVIQTGVGKKKIVVLNLEGVIQDLGSAPLMSSVAYDHRRFLEMIKYAAEDPQVGGVILRVNTPGGGVVESAEIHAELKNLVAKDIPLYVSMGNTAASGGYYVSAPATKIVAHPATLTGSIGVIMQNVDISELAKEYGIDFNTIKSGEFKDILSPMRKMTEAEEELLQEMVDDMYSDFVDVIVEGRGMPEGDVRKIADGRVFTGKQAKENGLVDELGSLDDTIAMLKDDYGLENARVVEYEVSISLSKIFTLSAKNILSKDQELLNVLNLLKESSGPRIMYLYAG